MLPAYGDKFRKIKIVCQGVFEKKFTYSTTRPVNTFSRRTLFAEKVFMRVKIEKLFRFVKGAENYILSSRLKLYMLLLKQYLKAKLVIRGAAAKLGLRFTKIQTKNAKISSQQRKPIFQPQSNAFSILNSLEIDIGFACNLISLAYLFPSIFRVFFSPLWRVFQLHISIQPSI
jgi:hypothetical protein